MHDPDRHRPPHDRRLHGLLPGRSAHRPRTGTYGALIGYKGLGTLSEDGLHGDDSYYIFLWPKWSEHVMEGLYQELAEAYGRGMLPEIANNAGLLEQARAAGLSCTASRPLRV
jgi:hypothetical protein